MRLSVGLALLVGAVTGIISDARYQQHQFGMVMTALQVSQCTKADRK